MDFTPLFNSTPAIILHSIVAFSAIFIGAIQFLLPKGNSFHRLWGYIFVTLLSIVAISGFFIHELKVWGIFSPIHLLSVLTLVGIFKAVNFARKGMIAEHKQIMGLLYFLALVVTGAFTFLPGRIMYKIIAGG